MVLNAFKAQNVRKTYKTFDLLGCSHSLLRLWIENQLYGKMPRDNFGKNWCSILCLPVAFFNLLVEEEVKTCFNWIILRPMYIKGNSIEGDKVDMRLYLLQEIEEIFFKTKKEGYKKNLH